MENSIKHNNLMPNTETLFKKRFIISSQKDAYKLPPPESMFKQPSWQVKSLQILKVNLNKMKSRLNNFNLFKWQHHTNEMNQAGNIVSHVRKYIQPELLTQAWCKFYEIASSFQLVPLSKIHSEKGFTSVHICEAPGAFVTALNHWLKTNVPDVQWNWFATTLNPYCEENSHDKMIADDRFIRHTLQNWFFGADNTGNIMVLKNMDALTEKVSKSCDQQGHCLLVTADGSIDCIDMPGEQERIVAQLHLCETVTCMHLLQKGGNFLLKLFTLFEHHSICLMYLLSCVFHEVAVTKPASSKGGNSEIYVVCTNFKGRNYVTPYLNILRQHYGDILPAKAMFNLRDIPDDFLRKIEKCSEFYKNHQCQIIQNNIRSFGMKKLTNHYYNELRQIKQIVADEYIRNCRLNCMNPANQIVGQEVIERSKCFVNKKLYFDSYNERNKQNLNLEKRLWQIWNEMKQLTSLMEISKMYTWDPLAFSVLKIQTGKLFNKIRSSRFCDARILQILNTIDKLMQDSIIHFPSTEAIRQFTEQQTDSNYEILNFQYFHNYDSHRTITEIYNQLKKFQTGQTLILFGYSLLSQLNVGLLYLLSNSFKKITIEVTCEGYCIKLENYWHNEKILNNLCEIFATSYNAHKENMAVWSIIPITILYECEQFPIIMQLNHRVIQIYTHYIINNMKTET